MEIRHKSADIKLLGFHLDSLSSVFSLLALGMFSQPLKGEDVQASVLKEGSVLFRHIWYKIWYFLEMIIK